MSTIHGSWRRLERAMVVAFHRAVVRPLRLQQLVDMLARRLR